MRIGLDFDNTIVCYDKAIAQLANKYLKLPNDLPREKLAIRSFLRDEGREKEWSEFQGEIYGPGMSHAEPFEGSVETMLDLNRRSHKLFIISHRTLKPYIGGSYDLHSAAKKWIDVHLRSVGLFNKYHDDVSFLETREGKLRRIEQLRCDFFVDDLPEIFQSSKFPVKTKKILFNPSITVSVPHNCKHIESWYELSGIVAA